ncbi:MAG: hypothetical protein E7109_05555 [Bacteroidales bacterium]|nr:hypothetical protein [Bacteroidales bacterium]
MKKVIGDFSARNGNTESDFSFLMSPAFDSSQNRMPITSKMSKERKRKQHKRKQYKPKEATPEQRKAVEMAQNMARGRGKVKLGRENIHFAADAKIVAKIKEIHFERGITLNQIYNEALLLLVQKYKTPK